MGQTTVVLVLLILLTIWQVYTTSYHDKEIDKLYARFFSLKVECDRLTLENSLIKKKLGIEEEKDDEQ